MAFVFLLGNMIKNARNGKMNIVFLEKNDNERVMYNK